jgi:hypothetical protein
VRPFGRVPFVHLLFLYSVDKKPMIKKSISNKGIIFNTPYVE